MPTYEYECRKCGHRFEKFQPITASPQKTCPKCKGRVARLLSGGAGIIFKGSGFYQTDYKKTSAPGIDKSGERKKHGDSKPSETKKETTPKAEKPAS